MAAKSLAAVALALGLMSLPVSAQERAQPKGPEGGEAPAAASEATPSAAQGARLVQPEGDQITTPSSEIAVLQGLDKITARISTFEAPLEAPVRFGSLEILARACHKKPPEETPESAAFLEIVDVRPDSPAVPLFTGWMFASSPAISAVEHPVYDVWVVDCKNRSSSSSESSEGN